MDVQWRTTRERSFASSNTPFAWRRWGPRRTTARERTSAQMVGAAIDGLRTGSRTPRTPERRDVDRQSFRELVSEEKDVHVDDDRDQSKHVEHAGALTGDSAL